MKRFQNILVVIQSGFEELLAKWTARIARNAGTRKMCLMHFDDRPDPLLTRALGEAERTSGAPPALLAGLEDLPGLEVAATFTKTCRLEGPDLLHRWSQPSGYGWKLPDDMLELNHSNTACLVVKRKGAGTGLLRELLGLGRVGQSA